MSATSDQMEHRPRALPWWWITLPWLVFILAGLLYWLLRQRQNNPIQPVRIDLSFIRRPVQLAPAEEIPAPTSAVVEEESVGSASVSQVVESVSASPDDLTVINGIGPKIAGVLRASGLDSFARLAQADPDRLRALLLEANLRLADPSSWPGQARLAAEGKWDELKVRIAEQRARRASSLG